MGWLLAAAFAAPAGGQVLLAPPAHAGSEPEEKHDGFSIRKEDAKFNDALEDFER